MADFFENDSPHGWLKRVIYKKYLQAYVAKILNSEINVQIIDGFAGQGRYGSEWKREIESYGSPLIIIMVVLQYICNYVDRKTDQKMGTTWERFHGRAIGRINGQTTDADEGHANLFDIRETRIHLVERKRKTFEALRRNIGMYLEAFFGSNVVNISEEVDNVIVKVKNPQFPITIILQRKQFSEFKRPHFDYSATLTILDPFGYSCTPMQHVRDFLDDYSEVLISFMSGYVNRFCGRSRTAVAKLYGIPSSIKHLADFVRIVRNNAEGIPSENPKSCTKSYITHMKQRTGANYAQFFEVRGERNSVIYHLVHFANHPKALEAMKETFNTCTQYEGEFKMSDYKVISEELELELGNKQKEEKLAKTIFRTFRGKKTVDLDHVKDYVTRHTQFVFRKKALKRLEEGPNPRMTVSNQNRDPRPRRSGTFPTWGRWRLKFRDEA